MEYYKEYQTQLKAYVGVEKAKEILSEALYLISIGTNDFLENYYTLPQRQSQFTVTQYQDFLIGLAGNFFKGLYDLGARKMSITGLPPMGCLPLERTTNILEDHACVEGFNSVALEFNGKLKGLIAKLNKELPGLEAVNADPYDLLLEIITKPSLFGKFFACLHSKVLSLKLHMFDFYFFVLLLSLSICEHFFHLSCSSIFDFQPKIN